MQKYVSLISLWPSVVWWDPEQIPFAQHLEWDLSCQDLLEQCFSHGTVTGTPSQWRAPGLQRYDTHHSNVWVVPTHSAGAAVLVQCSVAPSSPRGRSVKAWGACNLYYWQSSSVKQLFSNCDRIEAKQQSNMRSKSSTNLIPRISIAKSSYPIIQSSVVDACLCLPLYSSRAHICTTEEDLLRLLLQSFIMPFYHMKSSRVVSTQSL